MIDAYRVLVLVDDPERAQVAGRASAPRLLGTGRPAEVVLSRLIVRPTRRRWRSARALVPDLARMATAVDELNALAGS